MAKPAEPPLTPALHAFQNRFYDYAEKLRLKPPKLLLYSSVFPYARHTQPALYRSLMLEELSLKRSKNAKALRELSAHKAKLEDIGKGEAPLVKPLSPNKVLVYMHPETDASTGELAGLATAAAIASQRAFSRLPRRQRTELAQNVYGSIATAVTNLGIFLKSQETGDRTLEKGVRAEARDAFEEFKKTPLLATRHERRAKLLADAIAHLVLNEYDFRPEDIERLMLILSRKSFLPPRVELQAESPPTAIKKFIPESDALAIREEMPTLATKIFGKGTSILGATTKVITPDELEKLIARSPELKALAFVDYIGSKLEKNPDYLKDLVERADKRRLPVVVRLPFGLRLKYRLPPLRKL